jgi:hypothetical protein
MARKLCDLQIPRSSARSGFPVQTLASGANKRSPAHDAAGSARRIDQVAAGFAVFLVFDFVLRAGAGAMLMGSPEGAAAVGSGPALNKRRHSGESCDLFWIMQAVMRSTSGIKAPQSRMASGWQACCSSAV